MIESDITKFDATQKLWQQYKQKENQSLLTVELPRDYFQDKTSLKMPSRNTSRKGSHFEDDTSAEIKRYYMESEKNISK